MDQSSEYIDFILDKFSSLGFITARKKKSAKKSEEFLRQKEIEKQFPFSKKIG